MPDLDKAIYEYLSVSKKLTEYLFSRYTSKSKVPTCNKPLKDPNKLWFNGLKKMGKTLARKRIRVEKRV